MRTWRSPMSAASQGAFVVIPEISHSDISYIIKKERDARARNFMRAKILTFVPLFQQWLSMVVHIVVELKNRFSVRNREDDDAIALAAHI